MQLLGVDAQSVLIATSMAMALYLKAGLPRRAISQP